MDLQTTNTLDLKVTKEDLIDIIIDEQLTRLEEQLDAENLQLNVYQLQKQTLNEKFKNDFEKKLLKLLPKELNLPKPEKINYNNSYQSTEIGFYFKGYKIVISGSTINPENENNKSKLTAIDNLMTPVIERRDAIQQQISNLNSNNKRVKAKMIKTFLTKTKEGKEILSILGDTSDKKLLSIVAKN